MTAEYQLQLPCCIPLSKSGVEKAIVDWQDADLLQLNWTFHLRGHGKPYAIRRIKVDGKQQYFNMHRIVLERVLGRLLEQGEFVDHINGNSLDNRRSNLRLATIKENQRNRKRPKNNKSGFKGVCWDSKYGKWKAAIRVNNQHKHLGHFDNPKDAHAAYCVAALEHFGEYANPGQEEL